MLLKGLGEARGAPAPLAAAEMVIVRLCYVADLPSPGDLVKSLKDGAPAASPAPAAAPRQAPAPSRPTGSAALAVAEAPRAAPVQTPAPQPRPVTATAPAPSTAAPGILPVDFAAAVALFAEKREMLLYTPLFDLARLVRYEIGRIDVALAPGAPKDLLQKVAACLSEWTGRPWLVTQSPAPGEATLREQAETAELARKEEAKAHPLIARIMTSFPGAELTRVRELGQPEPPSEDGVEAAPAEPEAAEEAFPDAPPDEDGEL
jgi:DNA polymerase-3 subunit gamma/tau